MSNLFYGSICVTDILDNLKNKHSAFTKGQNGKIYASVNVWLNDAVDKYGNIMSVQINPSKENKDNEERVYIGNLKKSEGAKQISDSDVSGLPTDYDVPERKAPMTATGSDISAPVDDLPF